MLIDCSALVEANVKINNITKVLSTNFFGTNNLLLKCIKDNSRFFSYRQVEYIPFKKYINSLIIKKILKKKLLKKISSLLMKNFQHQPHYHFMDCLRNFQRN